MKDIGRFIERFRSQGNSEETIRIYTHGSCYHFALILNGLFDGRIMYAPIPGHFLFEHEKELYDITGRVYREDFPTLTSWEEIMRTDAIWATRLYNNCGLLKEVPDRQCMTKEDAAQFLDQVTPLQIGIGENQSVKRKYTRSK